MTKDNDESKYVQTKIIWKHPWWSQGRPRDVCAYVSWDDFTVANQLKHHPREDMYFTHLEVPPGKHLLKFMVDGKKATNSEMETQIVGGLSYNVISNAGIDSPNKKEHFMAFFDQAKGRYSVNFGLEHFCELSEDEISEDFGITQFSLVAFDEDGKKQAAFEKFQDDHKEEDILKLGDIEISPVIDLPVMPGNGLESIDVEKTLGMAQTTPEQWFAQQEVVAQLKAEQMQCQNEIKRQQELLIHTQRDLKNKNDQEISKLQEEYETKIAKMNKNFQALHVKYDAQQQEVKKLTTSLNTTKEQEQLIQKVSEANSQVEKHYADKVQNVLSKIDNFQSEILETRTMHRAVRTEWSQMSHDFLSQFEQFQFQINSVVAKQTSETGRILTEYKQEMKLRRKYFNQLQDLKGKIRVFARIRPLSVKERDGNEVACLDSDTETVTINRTDPSRKCEKPQKFRFDRVFSPAASQEAVFKDSASYIQSVLDGYNVCIFAYGQTGSGKTYTMSGLQDRALQMLFATRNQSNGAFKYEMTVSMLEIYNDQVRDLCSKETTPENLKIRLNALEVYVDGLTIEKVATEDDVQKIIKMGEKRRTTTATSMNSKSSRSHMIMTIYVSGKNISTGVQYHGKLHLIDLAGSERVKKSQVQGKALKEAQNINKSLSALADVMNALSKKKKNKKEHIPYRNSSLTKLLQDSLGGNSKALMFVNLAPGNASSSETYSSLQFAKKVKQVELGIVSANKK